MPGKSQKKSPPPPADTSADSDKRLRSVSIRERGSRPKKVQVLETGIAYPLENENWTSDTPAKPEQFRRALSALAVNKLLSSRALKRVSPALRWRLKKTEMRFGSIHQLADPGVMSSKLRKEMLSNFDAATHVGLPRLTRHDFDQITTLDTLNRFLNFSIHVGLSNVEANLPADAHTIGTLGFTIDSVKAAREMRPEIVQRYAQHLLTSQYINSLRKIETEDRKGRTSAQESEHAAKFSAYVYRVSPLPFAPENKALVVAVGLGHDVVVNHYLNWEAQPGAYSDIATRLDELFPSDESRRIAVRYLKKALLEPSTPLGELPESVRAASHMLNVFLVIQHVEIARLDRTLTLGQELKFERGPLSQKYPDCESGKDILDQTLQDVELYGFRKVYSEAGSQNRASFTTTGGQQQFRKLAFPKNHAALSKPFSRQDHVPILLALNLRLQIDTFWPDHERQARPEDIKSIEAHVRQGQAELEKDVRTKPPQRPSTRANSHGELQKQQEFLKKSQSLLTHKSGKP